MLHAGKKGDVVFAGLSSRSTLLKCLHATGTYEPAIGKLFRSFLEKGDCFVDVGANEGYFAILAGKMVGEDGTVYAVEPSPRNLSLLYQNIRDNSMSGNVLVLPYAAGKKRKKSDFVECKVGGTISTLLSKSKEGGDEQRIFRLCRKIPFATGVTSVEVVPLHDLIPEKPVPRLVKIDVEGAETDALMGMEKLVIAWTPCGITCYVIEMVPSRSRYIWNLLVRRCGYSAFSIKVDSLAYPGDTPPRWEIADKRDTSLKNVFFVPPLPLFAGDDNKF